MAYELLQIGLTTLVLIVGIAHLILDQFTAPKSDIVLDSIGAADSYSEHWRGEYVYELNFNANNRGEDNGYVTSAAIQYIEFFNDEDDKGTEVLYIEDLAERIYGDDMYPFVILQRENEGDDRNERGELLVPKGDVEEVMVVLRIFAFDVGKMAEEYDKTRVTLEFTIVDNEQKYTRTAKSHIMRTRRMNRTSINQQ